MSAANCRKTADGQVYCQLGSDQKHEYTCQPNKKQIMACQRTGSGKYPYECNKLNFQCEMGPAVITHTPETKVGIPYFVYGAENTRVLTQHSDLNSCFDPATVMANSKAGKANGYTLNMFGPEQQGGRINDGTTATLVKSAGSSVEGIILMIPKEAVKCFDKYFHVTEKSGQQTGKYKLDSIKVTIQTTEPGSNKTVDAGSIEALTHVRNLDTTNQNWRDLPEAKIKPSRLYVENLLRLRVDRRFLMDKSLKGVGGVCSMIRVEFRKNQRTPGSTATDPITVVAGTYCNDSDKIKPPKTPPGSLKKYKDFTEV